MALYGPFHTKIGSALERELNENEVIMKEK